MDFAIGLVVGIVLTLGGLGVGILFLLRRSVAAPMPPLMQTVAQPAVMVMLTEPLLNHQLRDALAAQAVADAASAEQSAARFKIKLEEAMLDVQTGQRAKFYATLTATAWNFSIPLRPMTELLFQLHEGRVKIFVTNVQLAGFHVPRALVDRFVSQVVATAETKLNHSLLQLQRDTHVQLSGIETTEDLMIVKFVEPVAPRAE